MDYMLPTSFFAVASLICWLVVPMFHLRSTTETIVRVVIMTLGTAATAITYRLGNFSGFRTGRGTSNDDTGTGTAEAAEIHTLLRDAGSRLSSSQRAGTRDFATAPMVYVLGGSNTAKTSTILRSGLDPDLLAGEIYRDGNVIPTRLCNIWYTQYGLIVEAGEILRKSSSFWELLLRRTKPHTYRFIFGTQPPPRAVVLCTSCESFFGPDAATSLTTLARDTNTMLRTLASRLGKDLPVYVMFTKLDRVPGFLEYVRHLSTEEVAEPLGINLSPVSAASGLYAEQATSAIASALDRLFFSLGEFRLEVLAREPEQATTASAYEFPREMGKLRGNLISYLVDLTRPSHLSANPYLRGFYFSGVRAHISQQVVSTPAAVRENLSLSSDATRILSLQSLAEQQEQNSPEIVIRKIAQWCFLPRFFPSIVFADRPVLDAAGPGRRVHLLRRAALATACAALLVWVAGLTFSYRNNANLERELREGAAALPSAAPLQALAPTAQLVTLDRIRVTLATIEDYNRHGAPLRFRWGLYRGESLVGPARQIYFDRFRMLLLASTQQHLITTLGALPAVAPPDSDYLAAYNPLRAYLITTSNPEKSTSTFLVPVVFHFWLAGRQPESDAQMELARRQFAYYAEELPRTNPYRIVPLMPVVSSARLYLNSFGSFDRIYQNILTAAEHSSHPVDFNRMFPGSAATVIDLHIVPGSFTRDGFNYARNAMMHPDQYFNGEDWVLGKGTAPSLATAQITQKLTERYEADFQKQWQTFLRSATVVRYRGLNDARAKLQSLSSPNSALLALMFTASSNTAIAGPAIAREFQPPQALVPPDSTSKFIGPGNTTYMNGLIALEGAVSQLASQANAANDPNAAQPVIAAAAAAHGAVQQTAQSFNIDSGSHVGQTVISLLHAPINSVEGAVRGAVPEQLSAAARPFCSNLSVLTSKYPFARRATVEATPAEFAAVLKPGSGSLWQFYEQSLKSLIVSSGGTWIATPNTMPKPTAAFLQLFNRLAALSAALFPDGAALPTLAFNVHILRSKEIQSVTFAVDSQRLTGADVSRGFTWSAQSAATAELLANYGSGSLPLQFHGTWALFRLIDRGKLERGGNPAQVAYPLEISNTPVVINGTPLTERVEISGPGASLLVSNSLTSLRCSMPIAR